MKRSSKFIDRVGEIHVTKEGYPVTIIVYRNNRDCDVQFENGLIIKNKEYQELTRGCIKNPYHLSVCGQGYIGVGKYTENSSTKMGKKWRSIFQRSYSEKLYINNPTYHDVTVCEEWKCFQNFGEWYENNWKPHMVGWHLDKDVLIKGNKIYSPETCCFVPIEINSLLISCKARRGELPIGVSKKGNKFYSILTLNGKHVYNTIEEAFQVYKEAKEDKIKKVANKWRGKITEKCYNALMNYKVEITD